MAEVRREAGSRRGGDEATESATAATWFRHLLDGLPFPVGIYRHEEGEFFLADYNRAAERITEGRVAEAIGVPASQFFLDQPAIVAGLARSLAERRAFTERIDYSFRTLPRSGVLECTWCYLPPDRVLAFSVDITEQVRALDALAASEKRYRSLVAVLSEGVLVIDNEGTIRDCNPAMLRLLGCERPDIVGHPADDPSWCWVLEDGSPCPADRSPLCLGSRDCEACAGAVVRGTAHRDGSRLWLSISCDRLVDPASGETLGSVCSLADVSPLHRAEASLRDLTASLLQSRDLEDRRIARELHDSTAQNLTAASLNLGVIARGLDHPSPAVARALEESRQLVDQAYREVRTLSYLLHPPLLEEGGLPSALGHFCDGVVARTGIEVRLEISDRMPRLPHEIEIAAFRIVQESVGNAVRHARPGRIDVRLTLSGERLDLAILDDGHPAAPHGKARQVPAVGVGIVGMQERARLLGGRFSVELGPDGGTARGWLPISRSPA